MPRRELATIRRGSQRTTQRCHVLEVPTLVEVAMQVAVAAAAAVVAAPIPVAAVQMALAPVDTPFRLVPQGLQLLA